MIIQIICNGQKIELQDGTIRSEPIVDNKGNVISMRHTVTGNQDIPKKESTMKIIKPGNLPEMCDTALLRGICNWCGCVVEAQLSETEENRSRTIRYATCPTKQCHERIVMSRNPALFVLTDFNALLGIPVTPADELKDASSCPP